MPDLALIELFAADLPPRTVTLTGMSVTVIFTCLDAANRIYDWWDGPNQLTPAQIEQVQLILGDARKELMVTMIGQVIMTASAAAPPGSLLCDGANYARTDYPDLYASLPAIFIVDADNFTVPDLREKFILGISPSSAVGDVGGTATVTLSESEIPSHTHSIGGAGTTIAAPGAVPVLTPSLFPGATGATGGGGSHNNMPPYLVLGFYIIAE